jgi:glycine/D-amino acid oxidase-like deaminating enzyme
MYRRLTCASISVREASSGGTRKPSGKKLQGVEWASDVNLAENEKSKVVGARSLGDESTIAQVHPKMLCDAMWEAVKSNTNVNAKIITGKVKDAVHGKDGIFQGAKMDDGSIVEGDSLLFACGQWTEIGNCMVGVKYHSVVIPTKNTLTQSVFYDGFGDPEIYPRPDGTAYCCGFPDPPTRVTEEPGKEEVRQEKVNEIVEAVRAASGGIEGVLGSDPKLAQSCYLPTTLDDIPMMGSIDGQDGCFVAAGHGCWGILMGPASGEAMASVLSTGESTNYVDLKSFRPGRFSNMKMW